MDHAPKIRGQKKKQARGQQPYPHSGQTQLGTSSEEKGDSKRERGPERGKVDGKTASAIKHSFARLGG